MILKVAALCVAVAMICSALRVQRPEMATALSLAAGLVVAGMVFAQLSRAARWAEVFDALSLLDRADLRILKLPSTSPANARWRMDDLLSAWSALFA